MLARLKWRGAVASFFAAAAMAVFLTPAQAQAPSGEPIKIGFSMALTGPLAANGKQALLGAKIWEEETNKKGGLLGRPVKIVFYDDQSNPSTVPGIYTKLLDVDKVFIGLFGLAVNSEFNYPKYFAMIPSGPNTKPAFTDGFFQVAAAQNPKPETVSRPGILAQRRPRRARERQDLRFQGGLRQELSAEHDRLLADRARDPGDQPGHRRRLLVSARLGGNGEGDQ